MELSLHANRGVFGTETKKITSNLVLGMGFVTGRYYDLVPVLNSGVMFFKFEKCVSPRPGIDKWKVGLESLALVVLCPNENYTIGHIGRSDGVVHLRLP